MGILNLSPVAPLEATIRSDSRQNDVWLAGEILKEMLK